MLYTSPKDWAEAPHKSIMLFGMSGLGKTYLSNLLRKTGTWFHYSVDYRIGTRYMGEHIADNFKREAMKQPLLRELLLSDSVYIASNITFDNLAPLATYLGKPGNPEKGGIAFDEYKRRQEQHKSSEISALYDAVHFKARAQELYGYPHFCIDSGGSICEVINPDDPDDPLMSTLSNHALPIYLEGSDAHTEELCRRFDRNPKPMYYNPDFLESCWNEYSKNKSTIDPNDFIRWGYRRLLEHRKPRYQAMAQNWGVTLTANEAAQVTTEQELIDLISRAIEDRIN